MPDIHSLTATCVVIVKWVQPGYKGMCRSRSLICLLTHAFECFYDKISDESGVGVGRPFYGFYINMAMFIFSKSILAVIKCNENQGMVGIVSLFDGA